MSRRRGDHYPLVWRERIGFARLALEFGYPVVPFSMIGVDDMWDVVVDADDRLYAPARALASRLDIDPELLFPLVRGLGPTPLPRPQRIYGRIGAPIDARDFGSAWEDARGAAALRDAVRAAVATGIEDLRARAPRGPGAQPRAAAARRGGAPHARAGRRRCAASSPSSRARPTLPPT